MSTRDPRNTRGTDTPGAKNEPPRLRAAVGDLTDLEHVAALVLALHNRVLELEDEIADLRRYRHTHPGMAGAEGSAQQSGRRFMRGRGASKASGDGSGEESGKRGKGK